MTHAKMDCRPPPGKTYLTIGQDLFAVQQYLDSMYNASLHHNSTKSRGSFAPAATMLYTDIQTLRGLDEPVDYGSGVEYGDGLLDSVFVGESVGLQIGLWLNGTGGCRDLVQGELDDQVHGLMKYLEECQASRVFLRVGYGTFCHEQCLMIESCRSGALHVYSLTSRSLSEFDNPDFGYMEDPLVYRQAFRMLKEECLYQKWDCPEKVKFVFHSWAASSDWRLLNDFYPGNDVVDWIGISLFQQVHNTTMMEYVDNVLEYARKRRKPTMIAESTPFGGIISWDDWFAPTLQLIERYDISMWSYINCDWGAQPMWHNIGFGDTRLSTNQQVMEQWHDQVLESDRFLGAGSLNEYCASSATMEKLSHGRHSKRSKRISSKPPRRHRHSELIVAAFFMFWVILALWVWHHRQTTRQSSARHGGARYAAYEYGAVETRGA